jgi:hypothetical protein
MGYHLNSTRFAKEFRHSYTPASFELTGYLGLGPAQTVDLPVFGVFSRERNRTLARHHSI